MNRALLPRYKIPFTWLQKPSRLPWLLSGHNRAAIHPGQTSKGAFLLPAHTQSPSFSIYSNVASSLTYNLQSLRACPDCQLMFLSAGYWAPEIPGTVTTHYWLPRKRVVYQHIQLCQHFSREGRRRPELFEELTGEVVCICKQFQLQISPMLYLRLACCEGPKRHTASLPGELEVPVLLDGCRNRIQL